ncbi:unnamed protein product [Gordionus sp. m RMFG-2023]
MKNLLIARICQLNKECNYLDDRAIEKIKICTFSKDIKYKIKDLDKIDEIIKIGCEAEDIDTNITFDKVNSKPDTLDLEDKLKDELEIKRISDTRNHRYGQRH